MSLIPTILCGGAGSRLWPLSRELHPKPFIRLADGQSLLQKALLRGALLQGVETILTVTNRELFFKTQDDFREIDAPGLALAYILEPCGRGTAAAIAAAALHVAEVHGGDAAMLVLPADHLIADQGAFATAVDRATALAHAGRLVTFGIRPDGPNTGYGYIEASGEDVLRFVEKPSLATAEQYVASGRFLWNSGMFCFTAAAVLREMSEHCPRLVAAVRACIAKSRLAQGAGFSQLALDPESFARVPDDSIDYALMEKSRSVAVVSCSIGWSDMGSWTEMGELAEADERGNRVEGKAILHDVSGCYIRSAGRIVGAVGVDNLLIIDTPDALLVVDKARAQDVKHIYRQLKELGHDAYKLHRLVHRPWGTYTVIEEGPGYKIKRIEVRPGASLSLQMHHHRSEHWVVVSGVAHVVNGEREITVLMNESTFISPQTKHRLSNRTAEPLVMIEVQSGGYLGEDDIVRFDDVYGRALAVAG